MSIQVIKYMLIYPGCISSGNALNSTVVTGWKEKGLNDCDGWKEKGLNDCDGVEGEGTQ